MWTLEQEQIILANCLLRGRANPLVKNTFQDERNHYIFRALQCLAKQEIPIDLVNLVELLHCEGNLQLAGGAQYIVDLVDRIGEDKP